MSETQKSIAEIDKNLAVAETISKDGLRFYNVKNAPFEIYGLYEPKSEGKFRRMPQEVADTVSEAVGGLSRNTAGGRVRFSTDSGTVAIIAKVSHVGRMPHFTLVGTCGFDLYLDDPVSREDYFRMVTEIVTKYRDDERICVWDVYNEPGNSRRRDITLPNLKRMFETVRACEPSQPLTCAVFNISGDPEKPLCEVEQYALDNSDIISYHFYREYNEHIKIIKRLKKEGRPILNTEWLARCHHNEVFDLFPLFYLEKIGCYNWGFVAGKYQTYEPWEGSWQRYADGSNTDVDFTKWLHDLYRPNHRPYDPKEIELIKHFCKIADEDFEREQEVKK